MFIVFDIGATKTRIAVTKDRKNIGETAIFDTPPEYEDGIKKFIKEVRKLTPKPIEEIGRAHV